MPVEDQLVDKWKASEGRSLLDIATKGKYKKSKDIPPLKRKDLHTILATAGMTPALGNIADAADALLYIAEGEFGSAGLSAAAMVPIAGQLVSAKRALKAAKKSGEKMVTVYRGTDKWYRKKDFGIHGKEGMVMKGKFVGGSTESFDIGDLQVKKKALWVTDSKKKASLPTHTKTGLGKGTSARVLEFEMPKSYFDKYSIEIPYHFKPSYKRFIFQEGIPKEFLKKVHK